MKLPIDKPARVGALFALLDGLDGLGARAVLVGGLVAPLLLEALDPLGFDEAGGLHRHTNDCDIALDVAIGSGARVDLAAEELLRATAWTPERGPNLFRWHHASGLILDLLPVPAGIEAGDPAATAVAQHRLPDQRVRDLPSFYRGYELALAEPVSIAVDEPVERTIPVAGVSALLAMKLQVWIDRPERKRDAHDICWLLRYLDPTITVDCLRRSHALRPDLVDEILVRLKDGFSDEWARGVLTYADQVSSTFRTDERTEPDRIAAAAAVQRVLAGYRS